MRSERAEKLGTFWGVFVPNVTMMFGVVLFLRLGLVTAHVGVGVMAGVFGISLLYMLITSASVATIATNMDVWGGGVYYLLTRSLGMGAASGLGVMLYVGQVFSIGLGLSAFAYTVVDMWPGLNVHGVEAVTLGVLLVVSGLSSRMALRWQGMFLVIMMLAVGAVLVGPEEGWEAGRVGAGSLFYGEGLGFWGAFGLTFAAMTGVEAGMAMSGILKRPARSIVLGNTASLVFAALVYMGLAAYAYYWVPLEVLGSEPLALVEYSRFGWMVRVGICVATLSSVMGCVMGAPRMLQQMGVDGVMPKIFSRVYGKLEEPRVAMVFTVLAAMVLMLSVSIDEMIPMYSVVCLMSYGMLNAVPILGKWGLIGNWAPRYRVPGVLAWTGVVGSIGLMVFLMGGKWVMLSVGVVFVVSVLLWVLNRRKIR